MNNNWILLAVLVLLVGAVAGERASALYVQNLKAQREVIGQQLAETESRYTGAAQERAKYAAIAAKGQTILDQVCWESDSTSVLRWFGEAAGEVGVRLVSSKIVPPDRAGELVAGGAFRRIRIEAHLQGPYWGLVQAMERVERSSRPMVIESFALSANRELPGMGELGMTVSCLFPDGKAKDATTGSTK